MNIIIENLISDFIICFSSFWITTYIFFKAINEPIFKDCKSVIQLIMGCLIICFIYVFICSFSVQISQCLLLFLPAIFYAFFGNRGIRLSFLMCLLSYSLFQAIRIVSSVIEGSVFYFLKLDTNRIIINVILFIITFLFAFLLMKIKRLRYGFQFFSKEKYEGLGIIIIGVIFILTGATYTDGYVKDIFKIIVIIGFFISGFGLYLWIRRSITAHYREKLQLKSEEHYQELLKEKELENKKLSQSNEFLAKVVHRDNHLMSALNNSINAYFDSNGKQLNDDLLREIQTLAKERGELIEKEQRDFKLLPTTGHLLIDGAVNDLYVKAAAHDIDFNLTVSETVDAIIGKYISQTDLQTLLCDHIKDAIIAVDAAGNDKGKILVDFSVKNGNYQITVFDSGVDFEIDTLAKLGKERVTTHADSGGSGIGFMTTFETLRKAYASLMITEFAHKTPFSKSVSIIFDGENSFIIQSYRSDILKTAINRDDMVII